MSGLFGPILLQVVSLGVTDRTEVRVVHGQTQYSEAATYPYLGLNFRWKHTTLIVTYGPPSLTLSPLDAKKPTLLASQSAAIAASYRWQRTTLTVSQSGSYGDVNFQTQALAGAPPDLNAGASPNGTSNPTPSASGTGTPSSPQPAQPPPGTTLPVANQYLARGEVVRYATLASSVRVTQLISPVLSVSSVVGYVASGSVGSNAANDYPVVKGMSADVSARYQLNHADNVTSSLGTQFAHASTGDNGWFLAATESFGHLFDARTTGRVGGGVSLSRNSRSDGLVSYSIYPDFAAFISHTTPQKDGAFTYGAAVTAAPVLDPVRATVDPRLSSSLFAGWGYGRFTTSVAGGSAISLASRDDQGALNSLFVTLGANVRLVDAVSLNTGVRAFWQSFQGKTSVPATYAGFLGLTFGAFVPLNH